MTMLLQVGAILLGGRSEVPCTFRAKAWLSVLRASGIIHILEPIWSSVDKRLTKMPKLFFTDTGLVCYLTRWTSPDALRNGAAAGQVFETSSAGPWLTRADSQSPLATTCGAGAGW